MEGFVLPTCGVYTGELRPRTVQLLRRKGYFCVLFPTPGKETERCILRDIDGSKLVACFADAPADAQPEPFFADMVNSLIDLPVKDVAGQPDDSALIYPTDGAIHTLAALYVNANNVGLKEMTEADGAFRLELWETEGKETEFELYCEAHDFGFKALFQPYEIKTFFIEPDGKVKEIDFEG